MGLSGFYAGKRDDTGMKELGSGVLWVFFNSVHNVDVHIGQSERVYLVGLWGIIFLHKSI